ncbi:MAG: NAD(P)H-dependent oxidoreductase [Synergistaceae bacterium]|jgi:multimeric flavodoxin WrbA|nr:NAD(P)H-dependent oxidoreductase [Synergistaceae bacterium]
MKIGIVNGSPKRNKSASGAIVNALCERLRGTSQVVCNAMTQSPQEIAEALRGSDAIVFVFPLYVDGIPSHVLRLLEGYPSAPGATVYAIINNGFYEARQNTLAMDMVKSFCQRAGLRWGQALGAGGGGMLNGVPIGRGPTKNFGLALDLLAKNIRELKTAENSSIDPGIPRFLYIFAAHLGWRRQARKNGLKVKQLYDLQ